MKAFFSRYGWKILREAFLLLNAFLMIFPLLFMLISATKTDAEFMTSPFALPQNFPGTLAENFSAVWTGMLNFSDGIGGSFPVQVFTPYLTMFWNTLVLTVVSLAIMIFVGLMFGYAIGTKNFRGKNVLIIFLLIVQSVPFFGYIMPLYMVANWFSLVNRLLGVVPVYVAVSLPMTIILYQGFFRSFPKEIEEAAMIDGCNEVQKFFSIVIPLSVSSIVSLGVINFMGFWNEYAIANLLIGQEFDLRTINVGIMMASNSVGATYYYYMFMLLTLSAIPNFIFFTVFQKRIMTGVAMGGIKG